MTNHIQVANRIENFVFDKLIAITQTFGIEDFIFIQNNRVGEIAALRQQRAVLREALAAVEVSVDSLCLMVVASEEPARR